MKFVETNGPWPFITYGRIELLYNTADVSSDASGEKVSRVWRSRHHRKQLASPESLRMEVALRLLMRSLWLPGDLNWWIGSLFAIGSTCFAVGSLLILFPNLAIFTNQTEFSINRIFFVGSIPFTLAAWLQLVQAANMAPKPNEKPKEIPCVSTSVSSLFLGNNILTFKLNSVLLKDSKKSLRSIKWFGWKPNDVGWLSSALQFSGTLLFNINTYNAMLPSLAWVQYDWLVWTPNFAGSVLFLTSGYLVFIETCHTFWAWRHASLSWWIVFINLFGCICFMISAVFAIAFADEPNTVMVTISVAFTLQGAFCFLISSLLMLPETALEESTL